MFKRSIVVDRRVLGLSPAKMGHRKVTEGEDLGRLTLQKITTLTLQEIICYDL